MSAVSLPVSRPSGNALLIASPASRAHPRALLEGLGYHCVDADDPYTAASELFSHPNTYRAVVISLSSLFPEELNLIATLRRRSAQIEVWLTHTDGRHGAMAQAMRLGADGLLADDGLHRIGMSTPVDPNSVNALPPPSSAFRDDAQRDRDDRDDLGFAPGDPVLTADELRMLLQEQPSLPPGVND